MGNAPQGGMADQALPHGSPPAVSAGASSITPGRLSLSPSCDLHVNARFRAQRHQGPGLHGRPWDQPHAPRLGHRRQHQEAFHPRKPFAETLARPAAKGEIRVAWWGGVWGGRPPGRDKRLRIGKIAWVAMRDVLGDEEEGAWRKAIV